MGSAVCRGIRVSRGLHGWGLVASGSTTERHSRLESTFLYSASSLVVGPLINSSKFLSWLIMYTFVVGPSLSFPLSSECTASGPCVMPSRAYPEPEQMLNYEPSPCLCVCVCACSHTQVPPPTTSHILNNCSLNARLLALFPSPASPFARRPSRKGNKVHEFLSLALPAPRPSVRSKLVGNEDAAPVRPASRPRPTS